MVLGRILITWGSVALIAGCAATRQASTVEASGFLGSDTYALLQSGREGRGVLSYVNEDANPAKYDKIILEPVTIWGDPENPALQPEDRAMLANVTYTAFHEELAKDYEIVTEPGPTTMVVAIALTKAEAGDAALNTVSSIVPQAQLLRGAASFVTEKPAFVGEAQGEAKVTELDDGRAYWCRGRSPVWLPGPADNYGLLGRCGRNHRLLERVEPVPFLSGAR